MFKIFKYIIPSFIICNLLFTIIAWAAPVQKFPPVSGEIYGQVSPGVKSITVNNRAVTIDAGHNFRTLVNLKAGEKYVVLRINYEGFRLIKKYLIIRKPETKTFKVFVPKEKIEQAANLALPEEKIVPSAKKKVTVKTKAAKMPATKKWQLVKVKGKLVRRLMPQPVGPKLKPAKKAPKTVVYEYLYVWEFSQGKLLVVKKHNGKYTAEIFNPVTQEWVDLKNLSRKELDELINRPLSPENHKKK